MQVVSGQKVNVDFWRFDKHLVDMIKYYCWMPKKQQDMYLLRKYIIKILLSDKRSRRSFRKTEIE